jgi:GrpB-like predicted nucleotidyltransferase (UPF0157 family)
LPGALTLVPYDDRWPAVFAREKARLESALAPYLLATEHIGSTSVPGLAAKPTIDILAGIYRLSDAPRIIPRMGRLGYEYLQEPEAELPERRYFRLLGAGDGPHLFHVHMAQVGGPFWERHLLFRDFLKSHAEVAREYEALKWKLADLHGSDVAAYADAKTPFIRKVEAEAEAERAKRPLLRPGAAGAPPHR